MKIEGCTVLITGASRGIGAALARQLAAKKVDLLLASRTVSQELGDELLQLGAKTVRQYAVDLSDREKVAEFCQQISDEKVEVDILVNNAGLLTGGLFEEQAFDEIEKMLSVNLNALIQLSRFFLPGMVARGRGKLINNASVSGKMFLPCASTYAASKAAVVAFTESLKQELGGTGVSTLLLITPGVKSDMYDDIAVRYGKNLELKGMDSIPAEVWSKRVEDAIENDTDVLWPPAGSTRVGVWIGHHLPGLLAGMVRPRFKRS